MTQSYCSSNYRNSDSCRSFSLLKAIAKRLSLLFANAFKSNNYKEAIQKRSHEPIYKNWSKEIKRDNFCYRKVVRAIPKWGAKEKSPILLSRYWKNYHFQRVTIIISHFDGSNNIFVGCKYLMIFLGSYDTKRDFEMLAQEMSAVEKGRNNRLFYLALPPSVFKPVTTMIKVLIDS